MSAPMIERGCIFTHEGRSFEAAVAFVSERAIVAYIGKIDGAGWFPVTRWNGERLGRARPTSTWRIKSWCSDTMSAWEIILDDGRRYRGRGIGAGFIVRGKREAADLFRCSAERSMGFTCAERDECDGAKCEGGKA